jgi:hypothetical protein
MERYKKYFKEESMEILVARAKTSRNFPIDKKKEGFGIEFDDYEMADIVLGKSSGETYFMSTSRSEAEKFLKMLEK